MHVIRYAIVTALLFVSHRCLLLLFSHSEFRCMFIKNKHSWLNTGRTLQPRRLAGYEYCRQRDSVYASARSLRTMTFCQIPVSELATACQRCDGFRIRVGHVRCCTNGDRFKVSAWAFLLLLFVSLFMTSNCLEADQHKLRR